MRVWGGGVRVEGGGGRVEGGGVRVEGGGVRVEGGGEWVWGGEFAGGEATGISSSGGQAPVLLQTAEKRKYHIVCVDRISRVVASTKPELTTYTTCLSLRDERVNILCEKLARLLTAAEKFLS